MPNLSAQCSGVASVVAKILTCGVVMNCQSKSGLSQVVKAKPGVVMRLSDKRSAPASRTRAVTLGSSVRREATTSPDVPPPTMM